MLTPLFLINLYFNLLEVISVENSIIINTVISLLNCFHVMRYLYSSCIIFMLDVIIKWDLDDKPFYHYFFILVYVLLFSHSFLTGLFHFFQYSLSDSIASLVLCNTWLAVFIISFIVFSPFGSIKFKGERLMCVLLVFPSSYIVYWFNIDFLHEYTIFWFDLTNVLSNVVKLFPYILLCCLFVFVYVIVFKYCLRPPFWFYIVSLRNLSEIS